MGEEEIRKIINKSIFWVSIKEIKLELAKHGLSKRCIAETINICGRLAAYGIIDMRVSGFLNQEIQVKKKDTK